MKPPLRTAVRTAVTASVAAAVCAAAPAASAAATPGSPDSSFGSSGYASTPYGAWAAAAADVVQPDGSVVTAGQTDVNGTNEIIATRYTPSGQLDSTFGNNGIVTVPIGGDATMDSGAALALQPNGKILIAGAGVANYRQDFAVVRLNPNGSLDQSFGSGGVATLPVGDAAYATAVSVDRSGNIDVAGTASTRGINHFFVARLTPSGSLDRSFGSKGVTVLPQYAAAWGMVLQPNGDLVVVGEEVSNSTQAFVAARLAPTGSLDSSFGNGGIVTLPIGSWAVGQAVVLQPDGKIVIAGNARSATGTSEAAVARLNSNGSLDSSFASNGILQFPGGGLNAMTIDSSGRIYLAGVGATLMRLNPDGSVDTSFGANGLELYCLGTSCAANGISIDPNTGDPVLAGIDHIGGRPEIMALRVAP